jgi:hypothetical protein
MNWHEVGLLLQDGRDVMFFSNVAGAQRFLEAWSIDPNGQIAYGLDGRVLVVHRYSGTDAQSIRGPQVVIRPAEGDPRDVGALRQIVLEFLEYLEPARHDVLRALPVEALIAQAVARAGWAA